MNSPYIVAKFGGTSMGTADAMHKCAKIVAANPKIKLVVVSATSGTTNLLLSDNPSKFNEIRTKHNAIAQELACTAQEQGALDALYQEMEGLNVSDQLLSVGERLSSLLFVAALRNAGLQVKLFDVRQVMITDSYAGKAEPDINLLNQRTAKYLSPELALAGVVVTQGFIGSTLDGVTTTLGRGGSDYSAALLAETLNAEKLEIWTDVPGIMTTDPNLVKTAQIIPEMSFDEAAELANFGAKVLHPATLWPAIRKKIPVFVASTFQPGSGGTWIYPDSEKKPLVRAIALRKNQTLVTVTSLRMLNAQGFLAKLFGVLANHHLSVDLVTTSEVSVALTIDGSGVNTDCLKELREFCEVKIEENLSLIAIIGNGLSKTAGLGLRTLNAIGPFNIRLVCHGASDHNVCFLVNPADALEIINCLHRELIT